MLFDLTNLIKAYRSCRQNKRNTINALKFEIGWEEKLLSIQKKLKNNNWRPGRSICFAVNYPKPREIFAADFSDRVVHHLLVNQLEPFFEKRFIYDSLACRKNKGCQFGVKRLRQFLNKATNNKTANAYYLQLDIKSFFCSIDQEILYQVLTQKIKTWLPQTKAERLSNLCKAIVFHDPTQNYRLKGDKDLLESIPAHKTLFKSGKNKGLPIGNLTSQFFANVYLNQVDQFIKRKLGVKFYLRYADDMLLLSKSKSKLLVWQNQICNFVKQKLALEIHPKKTKIDSVWKGINFIGYVTKPNYILSRNRVVKALKSKLYLFNQGLLISSNNQKQEALPLHWPPSLEELKKMASIINSYYGHFQHANTYKLRKNLFKKHFGILQDYLKPVNDFAHFKIKTNSA